MERQVGMDAWADTDWIRDLLVTAFGCRLVHDTAAHTAHTTLHWSPETTISVVTRISKLSQLYSSKEGQGRDPRKLAKPSMAPPHGPDTCAGAPAVATTVDVTAARDLITSSAIRYVDVRTEEELAKLGHVVEPQNSFNVPYMFITPQGSRVKNAQFVEQVSSLFTSKEEHVLVGCQSGKRSELACLDLQAAGFKNVKNMGGGYLAWVHHGFPVHHPLPVPAHGDREHDAPTPPPAPSSQA